MVVVPLKEYPVETTKPVQPGVSREDIAQPYSMLAKTLTQFGEAATETSVSLAEQAGAQAVTRDANGDIQIQKAAFVGPAAHVYDKAARMAALAEADGAAQRQDIKLRTDFHDNPQGYLEAADQFAKDTQANLTKAGGPELGNSVRRVIERTTTQTYRGLLSEKESLDLKRADATMTAGVSSARDDLMALARGGVTGGPDWNAATDKYNTLIEQRVANPRLAYPREQADFDKEQFHGELGAQGFLHRIDETYKNAPTKAEGAKTALEQAQSILSDPAIKLSPTQREAYYHKAVGEVRANEAIRKQDIGEARLASQQLIMAATMGVRVDPADVEGVAQMHIASGDQAGAARLYATMARKPLGDDYGRQPIEDMTKQLSAVRGQAAAKSAYDYFTNHGYTPAQASGIVGNLIHESGLDPTAIHDQGTGLGLAGWRLERRTALQQFAREKGAPATDFQTQLEFLDKEIRTSPTEALAFRKLAASTTPEEAAAAFIHYERPQGYDPNNPAASLGYGSRVAQAKALFSGQGNVSINTPASALWLQANRAGELDTKARAQWKTMWEDYTKEGIRPPDKDVNSLLAAAREVGDHDLLEKIGAAKDQITIVQDAAQRGLPAQEEQIAELHRLGSGQGLQPGQQAVLKDLERRYTAIQNGLKDNPVATTVANFPDRFKTPGALNIADDQQLAAGLGYRARIAQFASQNWQTGAVPALDKADLAAVQGALDAADPAGKARIFQAITVALPEDVRNATLAKIGDRPDLMVSAAASTMMKDAPDVAQSILRGQQALKADPRYSPEKDDKASYAAELEKAMPASAFTLAGRTDPTGPYTTAAAMVKARYADLAAQANDTTGKLDSTRLQKAVDDVTGGVLEHNGGRLIAPARGMPQRQFDGVVWGLNGKDLDGVSTLSGQAVNADYLRGSAQLESVGGGRYFVRLGKDPLNPIYAYRYANTESPQKFILDLRGRPSVPVPRAQLGDVGQTP